jgi:hypothetical protein
MANHLAVATVTELLCQRISAALADHELSGVVRPTRPSSQPGADTTQVTVFLYRVTPNAALRNNDLPTRTSDGSTFRQRPQVAIDLHYLLSFSGDENQHFPQRALGATMAALQRDPTLTQSEIRSQIAAINERWLKDSNLADDLERVRFTHEPLSLDEFSKLWSVFFQTPYALSAAYSASVVLIEADVAVRQPLPVRKSGLVALPFHQPQISGVQTIGRADGQVVGAQGWQLEVLGEQLRGERTLLRIDGGDPQAPAPPLRDTRLLCPSSLIEPLGAGVHTIQVIHELLLGEPPLPHLAVESNVLPFVLRPTFSQIVGAAGEIKLQLAPALQVGQKARLLLSEVAPVPISGRELRWFSLTPAEASGAILTFPAAAVPSGSYLARLQIDGAESMTRVRQDAASGWPDGIVPEPLVVIP